MDIMFQEELLEDDWPMDCHKKYERIEVLGKGSFGKVWMSRRMQTPTDQFDDEYVAIKNIEIKNDKGKVYAEREIRILEEIKHPNVIRLIKAYPMHANKSRVVVMQLARGPNLHQLVVKRGALGLPLSRMVSRQLIAAVSYIHGRAVIHRDIKPSNCILALSAQQEPGEMNIPYDWFGDSSIWSSKEDGKDAVAKSKWKLMLVDFGFARALEKTEIEGQAKKMRGSIMFEATRKTPESHPEEADSEPAPKDAKTAAASSYTPRSMYPTNPIPEEDEDDEDSIQADMEALESMVIRAVDDMRKSMAVPSPVEDALRAGQEKRERMTGISMGINGMEEEVEEDLPKKNPRKSSKKKPVPKNRRVSTARQHVRSMSALGTKAYAAPEIRKQLRQKTDEDFEKANAAMTECVADYGMIVDAYSVGWTLRVAITGVPPHYTISEYMQERENVYLENAESDDEEDLEDASCCCLAPADFPIIRIRDPSTLPAAATILITRLTEKKPENRMTVREAQLDPWIAGEVDGTDPPCVLPEGDVPSKHGDPVVPLECATELSKLTVEYHMQ